jgi:hypothetical protein
MLFRSHELRILKTVADEGLLTSLRSKPEQNTLDCVRHTVLMSAGGGGLAKEVLLWYVTVVMHYTVQQSDAREQKRGCGSRTAS